MAYENVRFNYSNFCIAALVGTFGSIDITNGVAAGILQIKNSTGTTQANYNLDTSVDANGIYSLEYFGPRDTSIHATGMPFWTLERISSTQCRIREWELNIQVNSLELQKSITKTTDSTYYFDCNSMSLEYYHIDINTPTSSGSGYINVSDTSNLQIGDKLYLGPSSIIGTSFNKFESAFITSISGSDIYITSTTSGIAAPQYLYNTGNEVCFAKHIYLFSDTSSLVDKGTLFKLDLDGNVLDYKENGLYYGIKASSFGLPYGNTLGFIKNTNLFYIDIDDYTIKKSVALTNIKADDTTIIPVYDIAFTSSTIYRLQYSTTLRNNDGTKTDYAWTTYNYQNDGVASYTDSITMWAEPAVIGNQDHTFLYALVRDQYGSTLSGKTIYFYKTSGDSSGVFDDLNQQAITNASGIAKIGYTSGWYNPAVADTSQDNIYFTGRVDGSNAYTGSIYVWDAVEILLNKKFIGDLVYMVQLETTSGTWPTEGSTLYSQSYLTQILSKTSDFYLPGLSKFQFPGGNWLESGAPIDSVNLIVQLLNFSGDVYTSQIENTFDSESTLNQLLDKTNTGKVDQVYISRHLSSGHIDTAQLAQFQFIIDAIPPFWSEKNAKNTNIWIKLAPYGFSLNQATLSFKVREVSYAGDTGYVEYANTSYIEVLTYDAGGGILGLSITVNPPIDFHHNAIVYVYIEVYDQASIPNIIITDYWFKVVPDFQAPYITNESPSREQVDVNIDTNIEFDIIDTGVGVDISTLEFYINNRQKYPDITEITNGYHIFYNPTEDLLYSQIIEISVKIKDGSDYSNILYDTWRFSTIASTGPWFDTNSYYPKPCSEGVLRTVYPINFNVYEIDFTGIDKESIKVFIGGKERQVIITPIVYRLN